MTVQDTLRGLTSPASPREIVFVDRGIDDYRSLLAAIGVDRDSPPTSGVEVVLLDANRDGIQQISEHLGTVHNVAAIHILSHGSSGSLKLGGAHLDRAGLAERKMEVSKWGDALTAFGDILIYGCNVADGQWGVEFVDELASLTGADVAASTDLTGAAHLGGDWTVEAHTGRIQTTALLSGGAGEFHGVLKDIVAGNRDSVFAITTGSVTVPGGNPSQHSFTENNAVPVKLIGSATNTNTFAFTSIPDLSTEARNQSGIDGNGGTGIVDFSGFGGINTRLQFNIADLSQADSRGIAVSSNNASVFDNIVRVQTLYGGKGLTTFAISDGWDQNLELSSANARNSALRTTTLDLTGLSANVEADIDNTGTVRVQAMSAGALRTATASSVAAVQIRNGSHLGLDLSSITNDVTVTVTANQVSVATNAFGEVNFQRVNHLILANANNTIRFVGGASIPQIAAPPNPTAHFTIALDYSNFGRSAQVNMAPALDLASGQLGESQRTQQPAAAGIADWKVYSNLATTANARNFTLAYGAGTTANIAFDPANPLTTRAAIAAQLNMLNLVKTANEGGGANDNGTFEAPLKFRVQAASATTQALSSANALAVLTRVDNGGNPDTYRLRVMADGGTFTLSGLDNAGNPVVPADVDIGDARADSGVLQTAVTNFFGLNAAVTGAGTDGSPWHIAFAGAGPQINNVDTRQLSDSTGTRFITLVNTTAAVDATLDEWKLFTRNNADNPTAPAPGGQFRIRVQTAAGTGFTRALRYDADPSEVQDALTNLTQAVGNAVPADLLRDVTVTGHGGGDFVNGAPQSRWVVRFADRAYDLQGGNISLTMLNAPIGVPTQSASGFGGAVGAQGMVNGLPIVAITGSGNDNDALYVSGAANVTIRTGNGNENAVGGAENAVGGADAVDNVTGGSSRDTVSGGRGGDVIHGEGGTDFLSGGLGSDTISGGASNDPDWIYGGPGDDGLSGGDGNDWIYGGIGDDDLRGGDHNDQLFGGPGTNQLLGEQGSDTLQGGDDNDQLLDGGSGHDSLFGNGGDDILRGGAGNDELTGGEGNDQIFGDAHDDTIRFEDGWGSDTVDGGANADTADFSRFTGKLDVTINARPAAPTAPTLAPDISVQPDTIGAAPTTLTSVETIVGGPGWNTYQVAANWSGTLTIDDSASGAMGTLDLSAETRDVTIDLSGPNIVVRRAAVPAANLAAGQITVTGVAQIRVGGGNTSVIVGNAANPPAVSLLPPDPPQVPDNHRATIDLSALANATVNLAGPVDLSTAGLSTLQRTTMHQPKNDSVWQMVAKNTSAPMSLTFGDEQTGQFKTNLIPLSSGSAAARQMNIRNALGALRNIDGAANVTVTGEGTAQQPYIIQITSKYGAEPSLSSDRYAVSKLTAATGGDGQMLSFFTDVGTFGGAPGVVEINVFTPQGAVNADIDLGKARANSNYIETQIENLANVNTQVQVTGSGTHQNPWEIEFANGVGTVTAVNVDGIMKNTPGVVQLQNVADASVGYPGPSPTPGSPGTPDVWTLYNSASAGRFTLTYAGRTTGPLPWNATAIEIQQALAKLMTAAPAMPVVETVTVTGTGRPESPWLISIVDVAKAFPMMTIQDASPANPNLLANLSFGRRLNLDFVGTGGVDDFTGPASSPIGQDPRPLTFDAGAGNDRVASGIGDDAVSGGAGNDRLDGGAGNDEYFLTNQWGHDTAIEAPTNANGRNTVDFSLVTQQVTHILSGGQLMSGTNFVETSLATPQDDLTGFGRSSGTVTVHDALGFDAGQQSFSTNSNVVAVTSTRPLAKAADLTAADLSQTLRLSINRGAGLFYRDLRMEPGPQSAKGRRRADQARDRHDCGHQQRAQARPRFPSGHQSAGIQL